MQKLFFYKNAFKVFKYCFMDKKYLIDHFLWICYNSAEAPKHQSAEAPSRSTIKKCNEFLNSII